VAGEEFKIGLVQMTCGPDREKNLSKAERLAVEAARDGVSLVCLQELFATEYFPQRVDASLYSLAEGIPGPTTQFLCEMARRLNIVVVGSLFELVRPGLGFNTAVVVERGGRLLGKSRKNHIPDGRCYHEKYYFAPGDTGYPVFPTSVCRLAVGTCWDQWFPEAARIYALKGAELILYPTAIGSEPGWPGLDVREPWEVSMRAHAIANEVYVAAANRVGQEGEIRFFGSSFAADPYGHVIDRLGRDEEAVLVATVDPGMILKARDTQHFFRDRRPETYKEILNL